MRWGLIGLGRPIDERVCPSVLPEPGGLPPPITASAEEMDRWADEHLRRLGVRADVPGMRISVGRYLPEGTVVVIGEDRRSVEVRFPR